MPVEPPPSPWRIPTPRRTDAEGVVGVGADLAPGTMLAAYRAGVFPMPVDGDLAWFSPDPRAVLPVDGVHESRSLARTTRRRFEIRVDTSFAEVVAACADPRRPGSWITPELADAYDALFALGWAHSVETWGERGLVGGLFGIAIGGFFAAESKFHHETDASKAAVVALARLVDGGTRGPAAPLVDVQWSSPHLASLGVVEIRRSDYLRRLEAALALPSPWPG